MPRPQFRRGLLEPKNEFARRFFGHVAPTLRLFRGVSGGLTFLHPQEGPQPVNTVESLFGKIPDLVDVVETRPARGQMPEQDVDSALSWDEVRWIYASENMDMLPVLTAAVLEPVVIPKADGSLALSKVGYNPGSGIYYHVPAPRKPLEPSESLVHLTTCFSGVPFADEGWRNNILAWLLSAVVYDPLLESPLLSIDGNNRGIGKSSLAQALGVILTGSAPAPLDASRGDELTKGIGTRFAEGQRFLFIDNLSLTDGKSYRNERLASLLTSGHSKRVRQLGFSRSVSQTGVLVVITFNSGKLDTDLATRALTSKLYSEVSKPMVPYCLHYAMQHRAEIYSELLGLALRGPPITPIDKYPNFRYRRFLAFTAPRIEKHFGNLSISEISVLDDLAQEVFSWGLDHVGEVFGASEFLRAVTHAGQGLPRYPALSEKFLNIISERGRLVSAGRFLSAHSGHTEFQEPGKGILLSVVKEATKDSGASYRFSEVNNGPQE